MLATAGHPSHKRPDRQPANVTAAHHSQHFRTASSYSAANEDHGHGSSSFFMRLTDASRSASCDLRMDEENGGFIVDVVVLLRGRGKRKPSFTTTFRC